MLNPASNSILFSSNFLTSTTLRAGLTSNADQREQLASNALPQKPEPVSSQNPFANSPVSASISDLMNNFLGGASKQDEIQFSSVDAQALSYEITDQKVSFSLQSYEASGLSASFGNLAEQEETYFGISGEINSDGSMTIVMEYADSYANSTANSFNSELYYKSESITINADGSFAWASTEIEETYSETLVSLPSGAGFGGASFEEFSFQEISVSLTTTSFDSSTEAALETLGRVLDAIDAFANPEPEQLSNENQQNQGFLSLFRNAYQEF